MSQTRERIPPKRERGQSVTPAYRDEHLAQVLETIVDKESIHRVWTEKYSKDDIPWEISLQRPLIVDPANPFNNVAGGVAQWPEVFACALKFEEILRAKFKDSDLKLKFTDPREAVKEVSASPAKEPMTSNMAVAAAESSSSSLSASLVRGMRGLGLNEPDLEADPDSNLSSLLKVCYNLARSMEEQKAKAKL